MTTATFLIIVGLLARLIPHPPNFVPLGAIALYGGARLPRRAALLIPLAVLVLSDVVIDAVSGWGFHPASRLTTYATFTALAAVGTLVPKNAGAPTRVGMALVGSTAFFLVSNFAVWAEGSGLGFERTATGLLATYEMGLPFYRNTLLADLIGTAGLFALDGLLGRVAARFAAARAEAPVVAEEVPAQ